MGVSGDFAALSDFAKKLQELASNAGSKITDTASPKIQQAVTAQLGSGSDPYGAAYQPDKNGSPFQVDSSWVTVDKLSASVEAPGSYHQEGSDRLPKRMLIPEEGMGLPPSWQKALDDASKEVLSKVPGVVGGK